MQLIKSLLLATAAASTALAVSSGIEAAIKGDHPHAIERRIERRGPIHDIISILQHKKKVGSDFCSTFLHLPPYAATKTVTQTKTLTKQVPLSTTTGITVLTSTRTPPVVVVDTSAVVVAVTPTVDVTSISVVPSTSTVSTLTSVVTQVTTVATQVVTVTATAMTSVTTVVPRNAPSHQPSRTRLPYWLNQYSCPQVSKACSRVVVPKTTTVTKSASATATVTVKSGVVSVGSTSIAVVTPTTTSITTVTSTSTAAAITSTIVSASSSLVPVTATVDATTVISVTATATTTIVVPPPVSTVTARIMLSKASDNSFYGYVSPAIDYGYHQPVPQASALQVQFPASFLTTGGPVNFLTGAKYPNLGAISGSGNANSDLSASNGNYLYMVNTNTVAANSQSTDKAGTDFGDAGYSATYESQIWRYDPATNAVFIVWTNSDGGSIFPTLVYDATIPYLGWTGNVPAFQNNYSGEDITALTASLEIVT